jgi:hypothetical protein
MVRRHDEIDEKMQSQSGISLFEDLGKIVIIAGLFASVAVFAAAFRRRQEKEDYYDTLRKSYEGLSPDDYQEKVKKSDGGLVVERESKGNAKYFARFIS